MATSTPKEPDAPEPLPADPIPTKQQAIQQSIAHAAFVEYAIASSKSKGSFPADTSLHAELARTWAILAGSL